MTPDEQVARLFKECRSLVSARGAAEVQHYLDCGEYEMAFEGLVLELIEADASPLGFEFPVWKSIARETGILEDPVFDSDFGAKLDAWGRRSQDQA